MRPALTFVLCVMLAGCFGTDDDCRDACAVLDGCDLLPSVLGAETPRISAEDNCIARCEDSSRTVQQDIRNCALMPECSDVERCIAERTLAPDAGSDGGD